MDRRSEVINEALAEEVRRAQQRRRRDGDAAAAAVPVPDSQHLQHEIRERIQLNLIQIPREDCSWSLRRQQPVTVDSKGRRGQSQTQMQEHKPEIRWKWALVEKNATHSIASEHRRRMSMMTEPVGVTTQEAIN